MHVNIVVYSSHTTIKFYNEFDVKMKRPPEFYTGAPVDPVDLRFREEFLAELWETLRTKHLVLTAARRTGKTSIMDHMRDHPRNDFSVVSINVQDLTHPADFFQVLLDAFHDAHPDLVRDKLAKGWELVSDALGRVREIGFGEFKLALRESDPNWRENWRQHGGTFLEQARNMKVPILFIVDELPDMLLNLSWVDAELLREFLAWFRTQRLSPSPAKDSIRWLVGGSVNLAGTLDALGQVDLINDLEDIPLPPLTDDDIEVFVTEMLSGRGVPYDEAVPQRISVRLGRPIPLFLQMATQDLYRLWKKEERTILAADVDTIFDALIVSSGARTRLQHYYSRIQQYYADPKNSIAYALLGQISVSEFGLRRTALLQETERLLVGLGSELPAHERKQLFNQMLLDLENDFYIVEAEEEVYDFASGVLKPWWRKYYA